MTGISKLVKQHSLILISDDIAFSASLKNCKHKRTDILHFRLSELAFVHQDIVSYFDGMICLDTDVQFISENYSEFAIKWLSSLYPKSVITLLSTDKSGQRPDQLTYFMKSLPEIELVEQLEKRIRTQYRIVPATALNFSLTPRENAVLLALAKGKTIREIAENSNCSVKTIYSHKARALQKLEVHRSELFSNLLGRFGYHQINDVRHHK